MYELKTTFTNGITLARSNKQYGPKWGIFNLYQIVCIGLDWGGRILYPLKSILVKDFVKVASHKLVNPYHEFTISSGKGVGMAK